jgi:Na+-driven multidrug efflux pump
MGLTIIEGVNSALDTFISQAYGANNYQLCGVYLNRGRFVMTLLFLPIIFISFNIQEILEFFS